MTETNRTQRWLFKEEPSCYSFSDLERDGQTTWNGIGNALALKHLGNVRSGDRVLYYHTGKEKAVVGEMRVVEVAPSDHPRDISVTVAPVKRWSRPVTLHEIKQVDAFADWELVRISRLSVMPVSADHWRRLEAMSQQKD